MFDRLRIGDYIRWSDALRARWHTLPDANIWEDEPSCALEVVALCSEDEEEEGEEGCFEVECVNCCGAHAVMTMSRDEYENSCLILGDELLEFVDFSSLPGVLNPQQELFSFDQEEESIFDMIQKDILPL